MRFQHSQKLFIVEPRRFCGAFQFTSSLPEEYFLICSLICREALRTDIVFNPARVIESCLLADTEIHQPFERAVWRHRSSLRSGGLRRSVCDMSLVIYQDQVVDPEILHYDADAGFGEAEFGCDIDGTHIRLFSLNIKIVSR